MTVNATGSRLGPANGPRSIGLEFPDVERHPEIMSGAWVVKGARVPLDAILGNADDGRSPEEVRAVWPARSASRAGVDLRPVLWPLSFAAGLD